MTTLLLKGGNSPKNPSSYPSAFTIMPYYRDHWLYRFFWYLFSLLKFYLLSAFAQALSRVKTFSILINHPNRLFPTQINSPHNLTIHSFKANWAIIHYLITRSNLPSITRRWAAPWDVRARLTAANADLRPITLRGRLSGPRLRQGWLFVQQNHVIWIMEEVGRWPSQQDHVATVAFDITTGRTFTLLIPLSYLDMAGVQEESFTTSEPFYLYQAIEYYFYFTRTYQQHVSSPDISN